MTTELNARLARLGDPLKRMERIMSDKVITARAKAFSAEPVKRHKFLVSGDGTVRVWDTVAGHYTTCHSMSPATQQRIRRLATR